MNTIITFLGEVRSEMAQVKWPTKSRTIKYSWLVIGVSIATAIYLGVMDYAFGDLLRLLW